MRASSLLPLSSALLLLGGCASDYALKSERTVGDLALALTSPTYGQFLGGATVNVTGTVSPAQAFVFVEGERVEVARDGSFSVELPVDHAYRIVEVEARLDAQLEEARLPVFRGNDPLLTWPGGATARLLPPGLEKLGEVVGAAIDEIGWADQLSAALPSFASDGVSLTALGVFHDPTVAVLTPAPEGLDAAIALRMVTVEYQLDVPWLGLSETLIIGFEEISVGGTLLPSLEDDGHLWLTLSDAQVDFSEPIFEFGFLQGWLFDLVVDLLNEWVLEPLGEIVLNLVLDNFGSIDLGGPLAFETDLLGTLVGARLTDLRSDLAGLGAEIAVGIGEPAAEEPIGLPLPEDAPGLPAGAQVALGLHEGAVQLLMEEALLGFLSQDLDLGGTTGDLLGNTFKALPGGEQAPDGDGWCLSLDPGTARVARLQEGVEPLAVVYLPDFIIDVGIRQGNTCPTWLKASLAMELGIGLTDGTALNLGIEVPEGKVLEYGAEGVDEAELITRLGSTLSGLIGLLGGGLLNFDLADILGGAGGGLPLGDLAPKVVGSTAITDAWGEPVDGLYAVSLELWE